MQITGPGLLGFLAWRRKRKLAADAGGNDSGLAGLDRAGLTKITMFRSYFVIMGRDGGGGAAAAGEIAKVIQVFQPSGRFSAANSL